MVGMHGRGRHSALRQPEKYKHGEEEKMRRCFLLIVCLVIFLPGCALMHQEKGTVLVREAGHAHFNIDPSVVTPEQMRSVSLAHWEYAVMSENAYHDSESFPVGMKQREKLDKCPMSEDRKKEILARTDPRDKIGEFVAGNQDLLKPAGWIEWPPFLSATTWCAAVEQGLAFRVYERNRDGRTDVVISFRGTVFEYGENWRANLRWFTSRDEDRPDGNTVVQRQVTDEFTAALLQKHPDKLKLARPGLISIATTGHSLGGALAQQMVYAFPPKQYDLGVYPSLRIQEAIVFDPSPTTGWYWVDPLLRQRNGGGVPIARVFQHREGLAYIRLLLSYVYPPSDGRCVGVVCAEPKISEVRYFVGCDLALDPVARSRWKDWLSSPVDNHSMHMLACGIATAAGHAPEKLALEEKKAP
jgi:pimeloyl-ACP methyl ester carboxylesterase